MTIQNPSDDDSLVNIEKLKTLSDDALFKLADKMSLIVPPELERSFLIEALMEAFEEDSEERKASSESHVRIEEAKYSGSELDGFEAFLEANPRIECRYNETMVRLLVRDTSWAFAFWDVSDDDRTLLRAGDPSSLVSGYFLRVMEDNGREAPRAADHFDIPVGESDLQWYINLPQTDSRYRIDLCCRIGGKTRVLAKSNVVRTPRGTLAEPSQAIDVRTAELLALSGFGELDIPLEEDHHPSRILTGPEAEE